MKKLLIIALAIMSGCDTAKNNSSNVGDALVPLVDRSNHWYGSGVKQIEQQLQVSKTIQNKEGAAKNIILFIGDGMSLTTVTASRIFEGQQQGLLGEENNLSFDNLPFQGWQRPMPLILRCRILQAP